MTRPQISAPSVNFCNPSTPSRASHFRCWASSPTTTTTGATSGAAPSATRRLDIDNSNGQANNAFKIGQYASTNLLYYPVKELMAGGEFIYGYRKNFRDGLSVPDYRIQFSFKYNFSLRIGRISM